MHDLPLKGSVPEIFLPRLIAQLHRDGFEGTLRVGVGSTTKVIYFKRGEVASAASNAEPDRLAHVLIRSGHLTQQQLDLARSRLAPGGSLGKTLIEMGFLTATELLQGAREQVRQILASCCTLSSGRYQCDAGPLPAQVTVLGLPTARLILDALMEAPDRQWIVRQVGSMESVYRPTAALPEGLRALNLDAPTDRVARGLDGFLSLRELSGQTSLDDFTVSKLVLALDVLGLAERAAPTEEQRPRVEAGRRIGVRGGEEEAILEPELATAEAAAAPEPAAREQPAPAPAPEPDGDEAVVSADATPPAPPGPVAASGREIDAEPPPIPSEELPAFARPPGGEAEWEVDPQTGERVHAGPVRLSFDGKVSSRREEPRRLLVSLGLAALVLAASAAGLWLIFRGRRDEPPGAGTRPDATIAAGAGPADVRSAPGEASRPPPPVGTTTPAEESGSPPRPGASRVPEEPQQAAARPPPGSASPFRDAARYAATLRTFDAGDPTAASSVFRKLAASEGPGRFTLQLMIACEAQTLREARSRSGDGGSFFFVPFSFRGRSCYGACWGS
ncbi:MAG: DUF4388 domain-containing protein [Acidobacteriota bacterium]